MKGGTTHGRCTVRRSAVPPHGVPGFHQPDSRGVSDPDPAFRGGVSRAYGGVAPRWETPDRPPVSRVPELPPADTRGSAVLPAHLPQDLRAPSRPGTPVRHGAEQSQSVDPRPLARAAGGAAHPRRCADPLAGGAGAATRRFGGRRGHCSRPAGGDARACGCGARRRAGLPPFAHDGTERRIVRPQDPAEQTECYSGKTKDHPIKNVLLVNTPLTILFLSDTYGGRVHDKPIADATPYPLPAGSQLLQDLGFLAFTLPQVAILMPTKKPRGQELTLEQQLANQALHCRRLLIEHFNSSLKRFPIGA